MDRLLQVWVWTTCSLTFLLLLAVGRLTGVLPAQYNLWGRGWAVSAAAHTPAWLPDDAQLLWRRITPLLAPLHPPTTEVLSAFSLSAYGALRALAGITTGSLFFLFVGAAAMLPRSDRARSFQQCAYYFLVIGLTFMFEASSSLPVESPWNVDMVLVGAWGRGAWRSISFSHLLRFMYSVPVVNAIISSCVLMVKSAHMEDVKDSALSVNPALLPRHAIINLFLPWLTTAGMFGTQPILGGVVFALLYTSWLAKVGPLLMAPFQEAVVGAVPAKKTFTAKLLAGFEYTGLINTLLAVCLGVFSAVGHHPNLSAWASGLQGCAEVVFKVYVPANFLLYVFSNYDELQSAKSSRESTKYFLRYVFHEARVPANAIKLGLETLLPQFDEAVMMKSGLSRASSLTKLALPKKVTPPQLEMSGGGGGGNGSSSNSIKPHACLVGCECGCLSPEQKETLYILHEAAHGMTKIMNSVLSLAAMESGAFSLAITPTSLGLLLRGLERSMAPWALANKASFSVRIDNGVPDRVMLDGARMTQVFGNIVSNAFKFLTAEQHESGGGRVLFGVSLDGPVTATHAPLVFSIVDNGQGIPLEFQKDLFRPFTQITAAHSVTSGTGLGLAIVKQIVLLHKGTIECVSDPATTPGATMLIRMSAQLAPVGGENRPRATPNEPESSSASPATTAPRDFGALSLLGVDDDTANRKLLRRRLQQVFPAAVVAEAANGALAVAAVVAAAAAGTPFDAVSMDANMPVLGGLDATAQIRALGHAALVIIGVTGNALEEDVASFVAAGANEVLTKPLDMPLLATRLVHLVTAARKKKSAPA